jgi:hypothetical protein
VTSDLRLLEHRFAVGEDLEPTAARRNELDLRVREPLLDLGRQPDGPWLVVSERAVLDGDVHRGGSKEVDVWCEFTSS